MVGRVTISMLASAAGVSPATVSLVLNRRPLASRIQPETRARILGLAEKLHYRPSAVAKAMVNRRTGLIGFVCGGIEDPYFAALCAALSREAESRGYHLLTLVTEWDYEKEMNSLDLLYSRAVDGLVMVSDVFATDRPRLRPFRQADMPFVVCSECAMGACNSVFPDYRPGMEELFSVLSSRGVETVVIQELVGYPRKGDAAVASGIRHGIRVRRVALTPPVVSELPSLVDGLLADLPDVFIGSSDGLTMSLVSLLTSRGLRVPDDLSCVSIDGTVACRHYNPVLSSVSIDFKQTAACVFDIILSRLSGESGFVHAEVPTAFTLGASLKT